MSDLDLVKGYLIAAGEGLCKNDPPEMLVLRFEEIYRNLGCLLETTKARHAIALRAAEIRAEIDLAELANLAKIAMHERSED